MSGPTLGVMSCLSSWHSNQKEEGDLNLNTNDDVFSDSAEKLGVRKMRIEA
jgi:hypothetical protein